MHSRFLSRSLSARLRKLTAAAAIAVAALAPHGASAANIDADALLRLPAANVTSGPARAVLSSVPFSRFVSLTNCNSNGTTCYRRMPALAANIRWTIQFVSCTADTNAASTFRNFNLQVLDTSLTKLIGYHFVAPTYSSNTANGVTVHIASQPMMLSVEPNGTLFISSMSIGAIGGAQCAISGVQERLG